MRVVFFTILLSIFSSAIFAQSEMLSKGLLKYSATLIDRPEYPLSKSPHNLNLRLMLDNNWEKWSFAGHYQLDFIVSPDNTLVRDVSIDQTRPLNLSHTLIDETGKRAVQRIDRLYVHYRGDNLSVKFGRQAVTWGKGFFFQILDIFNPFSPIALDKEYKIGDDMLYGEWLFVDGSDLQGLAVPRRNSQDSITEAASSAALKYHTLLQNTDVDILFARHQQHWLSGASFAQALGDTLWRVDILVDRSSAGQVEYSLVTNLDYSWVWWNHNFYGYAEILHDSQGGRVQGGIPLTGNDYFATGLNIELHPLIGVAPSVIANVGDQDGLMFVSMYYNIQQNLTINASVVVPLGSSDTEVNRFGSLLLSHYF